MVTVIITHDAIAYQGTCPVPGSTTIFAISYCTYQMHLTYTMAMHIEYMLRVLTEVALVDSTTIKIFS
jgi:hypothetical protein